MVPLQHQSKLRNKINANKVLLLLSYPFLGMQLQLERWTYQDFCLQIVPYKAYFNIEELPFCDWSTGIQYNSNILIQHTFVIF